MIEVLIVDDSAHKITEIKEYLKEYDNIEFSVAVNVNEALHLVEARIFDLAFIDLALPKRGDEKAKNNGGLDFIREIHEMDWYKKPKNMVAVTQHENLKTDLHGLLEDFGVVVICSNGTNDISNSIKSIVDATLKGKNQADYKFDVLLVAALREEARPIIDSNEFNWVPYNSIETEDLEILTSSIESASGLKKVALVILPRMGLVTSSIVTSRLVNSLRPKVVLMPGICAGIETEVNEGDLIIINQSWEWQTGKWNGDEFAIEPYQIQADQKLVKIAQELCENSELENIWKSTTLKRPDSPPAAHIGSAVSGSSVIANRKMMEKLQHQHRKLLGLEMEVFGVYSACIHSPIKPIFLGFKSVCDFGTEEKGDSFHAFCAELSGKFTVILMQNILTKL
ncbi:MAG: response regulator [Paraglaciecola sp.]|uniref:phosphorylase family protein n=1 Tax=Paraglaciecola sp. TaxID=1920173 RepID=UPI003298591E